MEISDDDGVPGSVVPELREGNKPPGGVPAAVGEASLHGVPCDERIQDVKWSVE